MTLSPNWLKTFSPNMTQLTWVDCSSVYTCLQKFLNARQRDENTEMSCIFGSIFNFFSSTTTHLLPLCISIWTLFPAAVTSFMLLSHELYSWTSLEILKSLQLNLLHSFSEKLHMKGSTGHFVNAVNLSTVLHRITQSSINIEATQTILTLLESLKT